MACWCVVGVVRVDAMYCVDGLGSGKWGVRSEEWSMVVS